MYKKTGQSHHYLPRKGSYSTVPHRNGRVDVLPPDAIESVWDAAEQIAAIETRLQTLRQQKSDVELDMHRAGRLQTLGTRLSGKQTSHPGVAELQKQRDQVERQIVLDNCRLQSLKKAISPGGSVSFESAFVTLAQIELDESVFMRLSLKASQLIARAGIRSKKR